jgi:hypothetical protein
VIPKNNNNNNKTYKAEIINIAQCMKTKYTEDHFVNIVATHESSEPNVNSTIKSAGKVVEKLNQSNENSDTKRESIKHIKAKLGVSLRKKMGNQSNAWPVY